MTRKTELGAKGEDFACDYLKKAGYRVIDRNFRETWGELDIVAKAPDKTLVFVEVKTMRSFDTTQDLRLFNEAQSLRPEDQMSQAKLRKFKRAASLYAGGHSELIDDKRGWRLDMIAVDWTDHMPAIRHHENI